MYVCAFIDVVTIWVYNYFYQSASTLEEINISKTIKMFQVQIENWVV